MFGIREYFCYSIYYLINNFLRVTADSDSADEQPRGRTLASAATSGSKGLKATGRRMRSSPDTPK